MKLIHDKQIKEDDVIECDFCTAKITLVKSKATEYYAEVYHSEIGLSVLVINNRPKEHKCLYDR